MYRNSTVPNVTNKRTRRRYYHTLWANIVADKITVRL